MGPGHDLQFLENEMRARPAGRRPPVQLQEVRVGKMRARAATQRSPRHRTRAPG